MQAFIFVIHGFPILAAILKNNLLGSNFTLNEAPSSDTLCVVLFKYLSDELTSDILVHAYSPCSSKYIGLSIGLGDAPLPILESLFKK